jgi:hypothetical protein
MGRISPQNVCMVHRQTNYVQQRSDRFSSYWGSQGSRSERMLTRRIGVLRGISMQKFFFDMKDGVPHRDTVGMEFKTNAEAIGHCKEIAQHFRDESLRDDQDLEISVVNALGREIYREFVHRE